MLVPPENFGLVEAGIYRCSKLESDNFPFLETLKLKTLILLDAEKPPRTLNKFIDSNQIELFNLGGMKISSHQHTGDDDGDDDDDRRSTTSKTSDTHSHNQKHNQTEDSNTIDVISLHTNKNKNEQWMLIEKNVIVKSFEILLNKNKNNILLVDSTSTLVGILRKIQKWNFNSILNEYRIYTGNTSTSNYFAENFLELIQIELIPHEIDKLLHATKSKSDSGRNSDATVSPVEGDEAVIIDSGELMKSPNLSRRSSRLNSVDDDIQWEEDDLNSIDDDDMDDDLLSASPQIPANLLKLVEQRKHEKPTRNSIDESDSGPLSGTSPRLGKTSRNNSFSNDMILSAARMNLDRRRSSIESKFIRSGNTKFRHPSLSYSLAPGKSIEGSSPSQKKLKDRDSRHSSVVLTELEMAKLKFEFKYYKNLNKFPIAFENVSVLKLKLPSEAKLPDWFVRGRNFWEDSYNKLNDIY